MEHLHEYRKHTPTRYIYLSFVVALLINLIPASGVIPDIVVLLLMYWILTAPEQVGLFTAFVLGILADVGSFTALGVHSLAYVAISFILIQNYRRFTLYNYGAQAFIALTILLINQFVISAVGYLISKKAPPISFFFPAFIGAVLWPLLNKIMVWAYKPRKRE